YGRQYQRQVADPGGGAFALPGPGQLVCWSRVLDDEEALCVVNGHGTISQGGRVVVDAHLNALDAAGHPWSEAGPQLEVIANTAQAAASNGYEGPHPVGQRLPVQFAGDGTAYVEIQSIGPSETLVLINR